MPGVVICDPELTLTLPRHLTAATGMDALSHAVEGYLAKGNNPLGDAIALDSIRRVFAWLPKAMANDREGRYHMMLASMEAMMPCKGLGAGHALANTFGDQGLHHGTLVTLALPAVLRRLDPYVNDKLKAMAEANAETWGRIELEETKIGRLDHKIEKLKIIKLVPGVEWLRPDARSGDHGITLEEYTPFGVVGAVTPSTHSIPTLSGNIVNICAAGNAVVFKPASVTSILVVIPSPPPGRIVADGASW